MAENVANLLKSSNLHIQEAGQILKKINTKRSTNRHTTFKMLKVKDMEEILKASREQFSIYKGTASRFETDFSAETMEARRQ